MKAGTKLTGEILFKIFDKKNGLYSCTSSSEYEEMFNDMEKKYGEYFKPKFLESLRVRLWNDSIAPCLKFKSINKKWTTSRVEGIHSSTKTILGHKDKPILTVVKGI